MKITRLIAIAALGAVISLVAGAQDGPVAKQGPGEEHRSAGSGHGANGKITEIAADHITLTTETGDSLNVLYSDNTRVLQRTTPAGEPAGGGRRDIINPLTITDLKVGDIVLVVGQSDPSTKSIGAMVIVRTDAEGVERAKALDADYGKTWLGGKVTAIKDMTITVTGKLDKQPHSFVVDGNTSFTQHREAITLADIKVGDHVVAHGALKGSSFVATKVNDMGEHASGAEPDQPPASPVR